MSEKNDAEIIKLLHQLIDMIKNQQQHIHYHYNTYPYSYWPTTGYATASGTGGISGTTGTPINWPQSDTPPGNPT